MRKLYPYQQRGLEKLLANEEGGALLYEPGLGKTITAIRALAELDAPYAVVVCPVVALGVWRDELALEGQSVLVPEGTRKQKAEQIRGNAFDRFIVVNYEALLEKDVLDALIEWNPEVLIVDEAHKIKTPTAKRSKAIHKLSKGRRTWLLTGTPITRNLLDLYSMYKAIDPGIWEDESWTRFKQRYGIFGGFEGREVIGIRDQDKLLKKIEPFSVAARKEDVLDLPKRRSQRVPVYLSGADWKQYSTLAHTGVLAEKGWVTDNPLTKALRLQQLVGEFKVPYTVERIEEILDAGKKVVVFYRFRAEGVALREALNTKSVYEIHGGTPTWQRDSYVKSFQLLEGPSVFLGQIQAASTAITLTAAHEAIYHSMTFSYEDAVQSRDRIYRIGQTHPVRYQHVVAVGPQGGKLIDDLVLDALSKKQDFASAVMAEPAILEVTNERRSLSRAA